MTAKKILVVDDSCLYQQLLTEVIDTHDQLEVIGVAANGKVALEMMDTSVPDLVMLDILMPEMDGIQTLIRLRKRWPEVRTIMLSSVTSEGSDAALDALALGASDYSTKLGSGYDVANIRADLNTNLLPKIEALCDLGNVPGLENLVTTSTLSSGGETKTSFTENTLQLVAIGVSTGGPDALNKLLSQMPADLAVPVVVVQHMPPVFTAKLAARLDAACLVKVREAKCGDRLRAGTVYLAPGDFHMVLERVGGEVIIKLNQNEPENSCRPSVDCLFRSIPEIYGSNCLGVIMTGMGRDGLNGSEALVNAGASVIVQDKFSSIVWGMPKLVARAGLAEEQVPLDKMATAIIKRLKPGASAKITENLPSDDYAANATGVNLGKQAGFHS